MEKLCRTTDIPAGQHKAFSVKGEKIIVYHLSDGFFATQAKCPHMFASLQRGQVGEDTSIRCPLHHARFDIRTGAVIEWACFPPGIQLLNPLRKERPLRTWPVTDRDGELFIDLS